jgi:radical SAM superfamily enzyme YgiQ (UPF0313 family)
MLTLVNTNKMAPLIGPVGLDYIAGATRKARIDVELLDLAFSDKPLESINGYFAHRTPQLVGISFRNVDDCFWPSADWFVPRLKDTVQTIRGMTETPIVIGGVGFSILAESILEYTGADFGIRGDGESAVVSLMRELRQGRRFDQVPGLIWREDGQIRHNSPAWPEQISLATSRDTIDNLTYFQQGGQCGIETKRGCNRSCIYCADPLAKGAHLRLRDPSEVADEVESLLSRRIDVLHLCDSEFNVPRSHALAVCQEFIKRSLGSSVRWYTYMSPVPFDEELAKAMARAGCVGIDFTGDSACKKMLQTYCQRHGPQDLSSAVKLCRLNNIAVMIDLLIGGPGETPQTVKETIDFIKHINPDCAGASLGIRIYQGTQMAEMVNRQLASGENPNILRKYEGPVDLFKPTFYISKALGERPAQLVKDFIAGDQRFFEPAIEAEQEESRNSDPTGYNYNENLALVQAIKMGARGAYWDILRQMRD